MSYLVLARKYRPTSFAEVAGQDAVTRTLAGAIQEGRIGHAYLFTGPRGTGKTTSARLFAKSLNCEKGPVVMACGTCERCQAADAGSETDTVEIDGASNNGVDDVRQLRDQAAYAPLRARFKIYIIDEVHMLSKQAFNALLKTLEEPPAHVKFLFATTEPHKVIDTIISRCQVLRLSPIPEETIALRLNEVFAAEGVEPGDGVSAELARRARGGMRDALSMADQLLAHVGSRPTLEDLESLSSEGSASLIEILMQHVEAGDKAGLLQALPQSDGGEGELLSGILDHLRGCLLTALCGADAPMLAVEGSQRSVMYKRGRRLGAPRLEVWLRQCLAVRERLRLLPTHARLALEVALLDLASPELGVPIPELLDRLEGLEQRLSSGEVPIVPPRTPRAASPSPASSPVQQPRRDLPTSEPVQRRTSPGPATPAPTEPSRRADSPSQVPPSATAQAPQPMGGDMRAPDPGGRSVDPVGSVRRVDPVVEALPSSPAHHQNPDHSSDAGPDAGGHSQRRSSGGVATAQPAAVATAPAPHEQGATMTASAAPVQPASAPSGQSAGPAARGPMPAPAESEVRLQPKAPTLKCDAAPPAELRPNPPQPQPAVAAPDHPATPRLRANSRAETWEQLLIALGQRAVGLGDVMSRRGKLVILDESRAVVRFAGLHDGDRLVLQEERNRRLASRILSEMLGRELMLEFEDADVARPGAKDTFTSEVASLFQGRIEE